MMWGNQLTGLLSFMAVMRAAYETDHAYQDTLSGQANNYHVSPEMTSEEALRVQRFRSFPPEAQEKALLYLQNLRRYLEEGGVNPGHKSTQ